MPPLKYSKQREAIKSFLACRLDHPTADTIYSALREEYPNLSLGTVYRNLSLLSDLGEITKITTGEGPDRFDGNTSRHHHFICTCCHQVNDLDMENIDFIMETASKNFDGHIDSYFVNFYGICKNCLEKKQ